MNKKNKIIFLIGLFLFLTMFLLLEIDFVEEIDHYSIAIQNIFSNSSFYLFFYIITNMMTILGIILILLFTGFLLRKKEAKRDLFYFFLSIIICLLTNNLIKLLVQRNRPLNQLLVVPGYSFPSAHAAVSMVVYGFLIFLLEKYDQGKKKNLWIAGCILLILLTGLSRIYFNVHYITDVLAGFGLGLGVLAIIFYFNQKR